MDKDGVMKSALLIEGLMSYSAGFVRNVWQAPLEAKGYKVFSEPYTTKRELKADLIIAHSFGAGRLFNGQNIYYGKLITMDARWWDFWKNSKFCWNNTEHRPINFYQKKPILGVIPMRGYPIKGAHNYDMGYCGHLSLPREVFNKYGGMIL